MAIKASVVIPTFNRGHIIAEAVDCVLAQTFRNFELIIVDDGSSDDTEDVVRGINDSRIRFIRHEKNLGCSAAYNTGIRESLGESISFLDSDDLWRPEKLETEIAFLDSHPEVQAVFSDLEKHDSGITLSFMRSTAVFSKFLLSEGPFTEGVVLDRKQMYITLLQEVPVKPTALSLRKDVFKTAGMFEESAPSGSDWDFLLRFARERRFGYIDRPLATLRLQGDATHRLHFIQDKLFILNCLRREMKLAKDDNEIRAAAHSGMLGLWRHLGWHYQAVGNRKAAATALLRGFTETGEFGLLPRALFVWLPKRLRRSLKQRA